jgi:hypothetical protein
MNKPLRRIIKLVVAGHVIIFLLACSPSLFARLFRARPEVIVPVEFVVDTSPPVPDMAEAISQIPEPEPEVIPEPAPEVIPEPVKVPEKKPPPKKKEKKRKIEVSHTRVTRTVGGQPQKNKLSRDEIQKLLDMGAKESDHTSVPDEDARCLAVIKNTLYALWEQPSSELVGNSDCVLQLNLAPGGRVSNARLKSKSGNSTLDNSVLRAAGGLRRIHGLTESFIRRHSTVTVSFSVEP